MDTPFSRVRFTCYLLQETIDRIKALQRGRPVGYPIDDAFAVPETPVQALLGRKTDRIPVRPFAGPPPALKVVPSIKHMEDAAKKLKPRSDGASKLSLGAHAISCQCDA